jgi:electron transport complex protein RnfD
MNQLITVSPSPHDYGKESVSRLMTGVIIALIPAFLTSLFFFGWGVIMVSLTAVVSCVFFEYFIQKLLLKGKLTIDDGSAVVTGLLLSFCLPVNIPLWMVTIGSLVAIGIAKMTFGGLGNNPFNPALVGRVFLFVSFPVQMTSWPLPNGFATRLTDAITGATPLGIVKEGLKNGEPLANLMNQVPSHMELFYGKMNGSMGEIAALALLLGFAYMLYRKIITWHIPVTIGLTVFVFTGILWLINPEQNADPLFHLLTGGLMLGAIFMATDYVTSPMAKKGMIIYGVGIGLLTVIIRRFGAYPEGVQFAILIMNAFTPLINMFIKPQRFGEEVKNGQA